MSEVFKSDYNVLFVKTTFRVDIFCLCSIIAYILLPWIVGGTLLYRARIFQLV
jgi:hypothetical protein